MSSFFSKPLFVVALLVLGACSSGPGSQEDFETVLQLSSGFNETEAKCIADAVFDEFGDDEVALQRISSGDYDSIVGDNEDVNVEDFEDFFDSAVESCSDS